MKKISWWYTEIGDAEKANVITAFDKKRFSMGEIVYELEQKIAKILNIPYVVLTNSGTSALTMALLAVDIKPGDEVIVPAMTWIATAQAAALLGAKVVLVDCLPDVPLINPKEVENKVTKSTKVIIPVHLNGRACNLEVLKSIAQDVNAYLIEDTCKAMFSKHNTKYLGTFGHMGCFSMGMISMLSVGYGGFVVTGDKKTYKKLCLIRDHGVVRQPEKYECLGFNFKISDILASIGLAQLDRLNNRIKHVHTIYNSYKKGLLSHKKIKILPVDVSSGAVPLYTEVYTEYREEIISFLKAHNVETSQFHLSLQQATYLENHGDYPNASNFANRCFIVPSGTSQPLSHIDFCIDLICQWNRRMENI